MGNRWANKKFIIAFALALLICACATTHDRENRFDTLVSARFNSITKIHCLNRTVLSEATRAEFHVKVQQSRDNPLRVCYDLAGREACFETSRNYTYTECHETTPPYKHCHDDRFDGNEVWKIYHIGAGDTLMLGKDIFVAITGEGCFAAAKQ